MAETEHERYVRHLAMARFGREYLALHGWNAFDGFAQLIMGDSAPITQIWLAQRHRCPAGQMATRGAATIPQLWGAGNLHLHPAS